MDVMTRVLPVCIYDPPLSFIMMLALWAKAVYIDLTHVKLHDPTATTVHQKQGAH